MFYQLLQIKKFESCTCKKSSDFVGKDIDFTDDAIKELNKVLPKGFTWKII